MKEILDVIRKTIYSFFDIPDGHTEIPISTSDKNKLLLEVYKVICNNIKVLEQEPCEEMISRTDMLDAIGHGTTYTTDELQKIIKGLPTVNLNTERSSLCEET